MLAKFSIQTNSIRSKFIHPSNGAKQRLPFVHLHFNSLCKQPFKPLKQVRVDQVLLLYCESSSFISSLFATNTLILGKAELENFDHIFSALSSFSKALGLSINLYKLGIDMNKEFH